MTRKNPAQTPCGRSGAGQKIQPEYKGMILMMREQLGLEMKGESKEITSKVSLVLHAT
jgi:hypothetical protein